MCHWADRSMTLCGTEPRVIRRDRTLSIRVAYLFAGGLAVPTVLIPLLAAGRMWGLSIALSPFVRPERAALLAAGCLAGSWLHEALHAFGWRLAAGSTEDAVRIGWARSALAPCAVLDRRVPARAYRFGVALPGLLLGAAPLIVGLALAAPWLLWLGILLCVAALGDALVLLRLRGIHGDRLVRDHPSRAGCTVES